MVNNMIPKPILTAVSVFYFWLRSKQRYDVLENQEVSYSVPIKQKDTIVQMHVVELLHSVNYGRWWIPTLRRVIYKATFSKLVRGRVVVVKEGWYPMMNYIGITDPKYPLMIISAAHMERHLSMEKSDENDS